MINIYRLMRLIRGRNADKVISIKPRGVRKGYVLLSYLISPFLSKNNLGVSTSHTNEWECLEIADIFLKYGYCVDVINWDDNKFIPKRDYSFCIDIHNNLERLAPHLNEDCKKILHITGAHWLFQNQAEYSRILAVQQRRGVTLKPRRVAPPSLGIEYADYATILGNQFTISTFSYAKKPIFRIPISTSFIYPSPDNKDYQACRNNFLWFGGSGLVHKGLDLVLEVFAEMPEYHLTICGPIQNEKDFETLFFKELYQTPNIHTLGWIDVTSSKFVEISRNCIGLIFPSCSEGQAGSVVTCLHAGLIPIVSYESGVDVADFGILLKDCTIAEIKKSIRSLSEFSVQDLEYMACKSWEFARENHTKYRFSKAYQHFIADILRNMSGHKDVK